MRNAAHVTRDLADHVPGHSLIAKLLTEWDAGRIRVEASGDLVIDRESRGWYLGVLGERHMASILTELPESVTVLHSVPIGTQGADVDHLVIAPSGVYTINTKFHQGADIWTAGYGLKVNGVSHAAYLRKAAREAARVEQKLSTAAGLAVPVYPIVAFVDPARFTSSAPNEIDGVRVYATTANRVVALVDSRRELTDDQVARIAAVARTPPTWLKTFPATGPGVHLNQEFDALQAALDQAFTPRSAPRPVEARRLRVQGPQTVGQRIAAVLLGGCIAVLALPILGYLLLNAVALLLGAAFSR